MAAFSDTIHNRVGGQNCPPVTAYTKAYAYDGDGNLIYEGWSRGTTRATSEASWAIVKYTYTGGALTAEQWAGGVGDETNVWDDRATTVTYV